jgi:uncharacterized protein YqeY
MSVEQTVLAARIDADLKQAMRAQDTIAKLALRAVKTALTEATKTGSGAHSLTDDQVLAVIQREAKRRREAAVEYDKVGATVPADQERAELAVLEQYLPRQLSEAEVEVLARTVIAETGATSVRDLNKVMPVLIARVAGSADGKLVSQVVRRLLGA